MVVARGSRFSTSVSTGTFRLVDKDTFLEYLPSSVVICNCKTETFFTDLIKYRNSVESSNDMKGRTRRSGSLHVQLQDYARPSLVKRCYICCHAGRRAAYRAIKVAHCEHQKTNLKSLAKYFR